MKILTVIGARPQFIKAATVSRVIKSSGTDLEEIIVHTGQHFDKNMSEVFFDQLDIPKPHFNLGIAGLCHGAMTGRMLEGIESLVKDVQPDWVLVYGDTNSTLAGALAAAKLHIPVAHVEAGLRSNNPAMPEEINRVLTDRVSSLLLCPTVNAMDNLIKEGFPFAATHGAQQQIVNVGDVMYDAVQYYSDVVQERIHLNTWGLRHREYVLCTLHRQENTDNPERLEGILNSLIEIAAEQKVVLPLHPRTRQRIMAQGLEERLNSISVIDPVPYLEMQRLEMSARAILTDSGGMQKEAYFHGVPCITLRDETEWVETVDAGWNIVVGANTDRILEAYRSAIIPSDHSFDLYGDGNAASKIIYSLTKI